MSQIVEQIMLNLEEIRKAHESTPADEVERQQKYVTLQGDRCGRCGELTFGFFPGINAHCPGCLSRFHDLDMADHGQPFMWFSEMVAKIRGGSE